MGKKEAMHPVFIMPCSTTHTVQENGRQVSHMKAPLIHSGKTHISL
jgi:hypothetical protein